MDLRSHVVYKYTCDSCQAIYIGQTTRHLRHRIAEHKGVSHLTFKSVKAQVHSNIRDHCCECEGSTCRLQSFRILATGSSDQELLIKERLLISQLSPLLNGNVGSSDLVLYQTLSRLGKKIFFSFPVFCLFLQCVRYCRLAVLCYICIISILLSMDSV